MKLNIPVKKIYKEITQIHYLTSTELFCTSTKKIFFLLLNNGHKLLFRKLYDIETQKKIRAKNTDTG